MAAVLFVAPLIGAVTVGDALAVGGSILSILLAPKPKTPTFKSMTSAWGETWPIVWNAYRVPGKVIQAGNVTAHDNKAKKGGNTYTQTFAVGVCEGVRSIGRIWADNQVIYDPRAIVAPPRWQANHDYGVGDTVQPTGGGSWQFTASVAFTSGLTEPSWDFQVDGPTRDNGGVWIASKYVARTKVGQQFNFTMRQYTGTETQLPDSALEEIVGVGLQPAYRGLVYVVFEDFNLTKFGNRIPNFEFELIGQVTNRFVNSGIFYGGAATDILGPPLSSDDSQNLYSVGQTEIANIKSLAHPSLPNPAADAASFGMPFAAVTGYSFTPINGKYYLAGAWYDKGPTGVASSVVLYELNPDGSSTALGCKTYNFPSLNFNLIFGAGYSATIRPDTQEVMICYTDLSTNGIQIACLDTINGMKGAWASRPGTGRAKRIAEIGNWGINPGPFGVNGSYCAAFVGSDLYLTLNKAHMDFCAAHIVGDAFLCAYYKSIQPANPNGALVKITTTSDNAGTLSYVFGGVVTDFGWPFPDEGLNSTGGAGQTNAATYDDWSPPMQQQEADGTVDAVYFTRGYSDVNGVVSVQVFNSDGTFAEEVQQAPFGSYGGTILQPRVTGASDGGIYLEFLGGGGSYYAKLGAFEATPITLADICADVSGRIGLTGADYDYSGLVPCVPRGCALMQRDTARSFLESLQPAFFFDLTDIGELIQGTLRKNQSLSFVIPETDLAASSTMATIVDKIASVRNDDREIPQDMSLVYQDVDHDYIQGSQPARRSKVTNYSSGRNNVTVPVVMNAGEAATAAQIGLFLAWVERNTRKITLPLDYIQITPADVGTAQRNGLNHYIRISKMTLQPTFVLEGESLSEDLGTYQQQAPITIADIATGAYQPGTINPPTKPVLAVLDTAQLQPGDTAPGVYVAGSGSEYGGGWDGETVQESQDDSTWNNVASLTLQATLGTASSVLGDWARWPTWDRVNHVDVVLYDGALGSATEDNVVNNFANLFWFENGEIVQAATVALIAENTYRLSDLLRGRFGTEQFTGTHLINEKVVMLDSTKMQTVEYSPAELDATRYWQGVNDAPDDNTSVVQTLTMTTRRLMPFAPYYIKGARDMSENLTITGLRRVRWRGRPLWQPPETDTPVTVEIDVMSGSAVVRTITSTASGGGSVVSDPVNFTAVYTAADQVTDFGSTQARVSIKAYCLNTLRGRGYPGSKTI